MDDLILINTIPTKYQYIYKEMFVNLYYLYFKDIGIKYKDDYKKYYKELLHENIGIKRKTKLIIKRILIQFKIII